MIIGILKWPVTTCCKNSGLNITQVDISEMYAYHHMECEHEHTFPYYQACMPTYSHLAHISLELFVQMTD